MEWKHTDSPVKKKKNFVLQKNAEYGFDRQHVFRMYLRLTHLAGKFPFLSPTSPLGQV